MINIKYISYDDTIKIVRYACNILSFYYDDEDEYAIDHCISVCNEYRIVTAEEELDQEITVKHLAYLLVSVWHDMIEDGKLTTYQDINSLIKGVIIKCYPNDDSKDIRELITYLTRLVLFGINIISRRENETYKEYIDRIILSGDKEIIRIKIVDIMDHLSKFETLKPSLVKRYIKALETITTSMTKEDNENE